MLIILVFQYNITFFFSNLVSVKNNVNVSKSFEALKNLTILRLKVLEQAILNPAKFRQPSNEPKHTHKHIPKSRNNDSGDEINLKLAFVGETRTGKTTFAHYYDKKIVPENPSQTIGASFISKKIVARGRPVKLAMWDVAGQEKYIGLTSMYLKSTDGIVVTYDVTDRDSYDTALRRYENLKNEYPNVVIMVIGNKADLQDRKTVHVEDGEALTNEIHASLFFEGNNRIEL